MSVGIVNDDWQRVANLAWVALENDNPVAMGAAGELKCMAVGRRQPAFSLFFGGFAWPLDQNIDLLANKGVVVCFADFVLQGEQLVVAVAFNFVRNVVRVQLGALRAGAFAVLEDEAVLEAAITNKVHRELKLGIGFAAKADNEVAADCNAGHPLLRSNDHLAIVFDCIAPLHPQQNIVRTALRWHVQILADLRQVSDRGQEVVRHVLGVVRNKLDSLNAIDVVQGSEQVAQPPRPIASFVLVTIDGLPQQDDFLAAFASKLTRLGEDLLRRPALFGATNAGHDAVRAELVAADHDADVCLVGRWPHGRITHGVEAFVAPFDLVASAIFSAEAYFHPLCANGAFGAQLADERGNLVELAGAHDQVDVRSPFENEALVFLSHAAEDANDFARMFAFGVLETTQCAVDLVFGVLADAAGVEQDRVGVVRAGGELVTVFAQASDDELAVEFVHLAADGFDVELQSTSSEVRGRRSG